MRSFIICPLYLILLRLLNQGRERSATNNTRGKSKKKYFSGNLKGALLGDLRMHSSRNLLFEYGFE
jgi:hypothetical protein